MRFLAIIMQLVLALTAACSSRGTASLSNNVPNVALLGQSNGQGLDTDITGWVPDPRVSIWEIAQTPRNWVPIVPDGPGNQHGCELTLCNALAQAANGPTINIAKDCWGGSLIDAWLPGGSSVPPYTTPNQLWATVQSTIAAIKTRPHRPVAWIWWIGESDSTGAFNPNAQAEYLAKEITFLSAVRTEFGPTYDVTFFIVPPYVNFPGLNATAIRAAKAQYVAGDQKSRLVDIALAPNATIHWGDGQQLIIGSTVIAPAILSVYAQ